MADNVPITAGSGTTVATDDVTGVHYQKVKLVDGTADSSAAIPGDATNGLDVDVTRVQGTVAVSATDLDIRNLSDASDSVAVSATNLDIRDLSSASDSVTVAQATAANLNATVTGTVTADAGTGPFPVSDNAGSLTVDAPVGTPLYARLSDGSAALVGQKTAANSLPVTIASDQSAVPVSGTFWQATQPVSGTFWQATQPVSGTFWQATQPVSGTVGITSGTGAPLPSSHGATLITKTVQSTTATTTVLWTPAAGNKIVCCYVQIQATGTTGGDVQLWFGASGDSTYNRGTDAAIFDGNFIPSATSSPGVVISPLIPFVGVDDYVLKFTTSAAINALTVTAWGYEIA